MTDKQTPKKRTRRKNADTEKQAAAKRAEIIRQQAVPGARETPGSVVGGHAGWAYVVIPYDLEGGHRVRLIRRLERDGYEKETDPEVTVIGHIGSVLYRIPQEIFDERNKRQMDKERARERAPRRSII
tara:strand:- start:786 stop:1169 length:384 start_codon:yes stop_codon:yes gene_type:complete